MKTDLRRPTLVSGFVLAACIAGGSAWVLAAPEEATPDMQEHAEHQAGAGMEGHDMSKGGMDMDMGGKGMGGMDMGGKGMDGMGGMGMGGGKHGGACKRRGAGDHGKGGMEGMSHGAMDMSGGDWRADLTDEQQRRLDRLDLDFMRVKAPAKARISALEVELAVLATAPTPDQAAIDAKVEELLAAKRTMLGAKYRYLAAQREALTPEQQVSFDMEAIRDAKHRDKGSKGQGCRCRH